MQEHLQAGRTFSEPEVQELAKTLLEILIYLHDRHPAVIHRDLKPSNILLGDRTGNSIGQVYLVDFGSVQTLAAKEDGTITVVGTYGYMPPEQFGGRTVPASDIYSLGATLIGLLTGTHPTDLPQKDGCIQFTRSVNISRNFANWLEQTIQPSIDRRFASARKALQVLENPPQLQELLVVGKPLGSKVVLNKNADSLKIIIPPTGFNLEGLKLSGLVILVSPSSVILTGLLLIEPFNLTKVVWIILSLPLWVISIALLRAICWGFFGQIYLNIDCQQVSLAYKLFGFKYNRPRPARREDITKLEYTNKVSEYNSDRVGSAVKPQINIWAGTYKYHLGYSTLSNHEEFGCNSLNEPELEWLAYELSDWLGMPIVKG